MPKKTGFIQAGGWCGAMYRKLFYILRMPSDKLDGFISYGDLEGYSATCEEMTADEVADFIIKYNNK